MIDGCDGTGKSSVCEKLANELNCNIIRLTKNGPRAVESYKYLMNANNVVHDRSFISELIYSKYFEKDVELSSQEILTLWRIIRYLPINFFILTANNEEIYKRISLRGDEFIKDAEIFKKINDEYRTFAKCNEVTLIDTTNKSIDEVVKEIRSYIDE